MNVSQKAKFSTMFPTLSKDFSEMRKFQPKPLKPRCNISNPEGFFILRVSVDKLKFDVGRFVFRRLEAAVPRLPLGRVTAPIG